MLATRSNEQGEDAVQAASSPPAWRIERDGTDALLRVSGEWIAQRTGLRSGHDLEEVLKQIGTCPRVRIDTSQVASWDSALVVFVAAVQGSLSGRHCTLDLDSLPEPLRKLLVLARSDSGPGQPDVARTRVRAMERIGLQVVGGWSALAKFAELLGLVVLSIQPTIAGRLRARAADVITLIADCGIGALGIVAVVNGLVGAILGFVGAVQFRRFGASLYVANLIGIATVREMAAVMTAIVMAGRTGGSYAAQLATMQGNEEIDALQALGIPVHQFLVVPRVLAAMSMMPILYFYACLLGLLGGMVVSIAMLGMSVTVFLTELRHAVLPSQFVLGFIKSLCFGAFIALASCRIGLAAGRSAADVGRAATSAVVVGIIGVIAIDAVFAVCADVLDV